MERHALRRIKEQSMDQLIERGPREVGRENSLKAVDVAVVGGL